MRQMAVTRLAWEREGAPTDVGVCLSGGGIRAAAFALGAIQALQAERRLLFGPRSARLLAAVSGGSYTAAAHTLNAAQLARSSDGDTLPPLDPESPEANHIIAHGRYLLDGGALRTIGLFAILALVNLVAFVAFFIWVGTFIALYALLTRELGGQTLEPLIRATGDRRWILAAMSAFGAGVLVRGLYKDGGPQRYLLPLVGLALVAAGGPALLATLNEYPALSRPSWWSEPGRLGLVGAVTVGTVMLWLLLTKVPLGTVGKTLARVVVRVTVWLPRTGGIVLLSLTVTAAFDLFSRAWPDNARSADQVAAGTFFGAVLVGGIVMQKVASRTSLHRVNRKRISNCFAVLRDGNDVRRLKSIEPLLTELAPPPVGMDCSFPRLLICAAANVIWHFPGGTQRKFAPFVFSHDTCGIPGLRSALLQTRRLEVSRTFAGLWPLGSSEPLLPLMSAVACTGAAVSPSMGKHTIPVLRPLIALLNLRLGRWLHNPMSVRVRTDATRAGDGQMRGRAGFGAGYDEFLQELLGMHRADAATLYVSDGGHYDNTGLLALLIGRCEVIWCVDSQADKDGKASQLREVIAFADEELGITIDLDVEQFGATSDGLLGASHAVGTIRYPEGTGTLIVIKLGLTSGSPQDLRDYRERDRQFPRHSTFTHIAFGPERMDAYRRLGIANARAAMADPEVLSRVGPGRAASQTTQEPDPQYSQYQ